MSTSKRSVEVLLVVLVLFIAFSVTATSTVLAANYNYQVLSGRHGVSGVQNAVVILVEFQDSRHTQTPDQIKTVAIDELNSYYSKVSQGKVSITGEVYGWYLSSHPIGYYGHDDKNPGDDDNVQALAKDALAFLPATADLTPFDFLVIVHAGQDQAGDPSNGLSDKIWSACYCSVFPNYEFPKPIARDSKIFESYTFLSEFNGLGTFAHEWGHHFGLPDLYDADNGKNYVGYWSLMDVGNYCCYNQAQSTPSDIGAWGDVLLGWLKPNVTGTSLVVSSFSMNPVGSQDPTAILIPVSFNTYYFIEYRTATGIDSHLPRSGILVYYVDETLETGHGILRLENPKTGKLYPPQQSASSLNGAAFQSGDQFHDKANQVYLAFFGGEESFAMHYSKQELSGTIDLSSLTASSPPTIATYGDHITVDGTLVGEDGTLLTGQPVELDILNPATNQWQMIGSTTTGQQGEISLQATLAIHVGDYSFQLLYPGGKVGNKWYSSSSTEFFMSITPATMKIAVSYPRVTGPDGIPVEVTTTTSTGEPLAGVILDIYVDNVRRGTIRTDENGKATLTLYFGFGDVGSHTVTARAVIDNYLPAESRGSVTVVPPIWLIGIVVAVVLAVSAFTIIKGHRGRREVLLGGAKIYCTECGRELPPGSSFCVDCGATVRRGN